MSGDQSVIEARPRGDPRTCHLAHETLSFGAAAGSHVRADRRSIGGAVR